MTGRVSPRCLFSTDRGRSRCRGRAWLIVVLVGSLAWSMLPTAAGDDAIDQVGLSLEHTADHPEGPVRNSAWSPDGRLFALTSYDTDVYVYDSDFELIRTIRRSEDRTRSVAWSPDGQLVAFGTEEPSVYVFAVDELADGAEPLHTLKDFGCRVNGLHFSPDGAYLAAGSGCTHRGEQNTGDLVVLRVDDGFAEVQRFEQMHESYGVRWSRSGDFLATTGTGIDNDVRVYDTADADPRAWSLKAHLEQPLAGASVSTLDWSVDGDYLAIAGVGSVLLYRTSDFTKAHELAVGGPDEPRVWRVRFCPAGRFLGVSDGRKGTLFDVQGDDPTAWRLVGQVDGQQGRYLTNAWSSDGRRWAVGNDDGSVRVYRVE